MVAHIQYDHDRLAALCEKWRITELALFGSVLRDDFRPDSDVDVLVRFEPDHDWSLFDLMTLQEELQQLFGRDVDVLTRNSVEQSRNPYRKQLILETAETIYAR